MPHFRIIAAFFSLCPYVNARNHCHRTLKGNCYHGDVSAKKIEATIDAVTSKARTVDGVPTSLADLGYKHVGVDDGWQACNTGKDCSFHAADGKRLRVYGARQSACARACNPALQGKHSKFSQSTLGKY